MKRKRIQELKRRAAWGLILLIKILFRPLPLSFAQRFGAFLGRILYYTSRRMKRRILDHMKIAFGEKYSERELRSLCRECFSNFGRVAGEFLAFLHLPKERVDELVDGGGAEKRLNLLLEKRKGIIIVSPHMGNWELLAVWVRNRFKGIVVGKKLRVERYNRLIIGARSRLGLETLYQEESPRAILRCLRQNFIVGILPDQDVDRLAGIFVDFFGKKAYTPTGPASLAMASGAPLLPAFMVWNEERRRYQVLTDEPMEIDLSGDKKEVLLRATEAWTRVFERYIREYPSQWAWIHRRWRTTPQRLMERRKRRKGRALSRTNEAGK